MKKLLFTVILLCLVFGTNNYSELNHLAIITNIGIEKEKNSYEVTLQEIIPKKEENKVIRSYKYHSDTGTTLKNSFKKIEENLTKEIYLDHLENIIISTDEDKILEEILNYFNKDFDHFNIIYTPNNPKKVMTYSNNYQYMNHLIKNNTTFRTIKQAKLEKTGVSIPMIKFENKKLTFYKYKELKKIES